MMGLFFLKNISCRRRRRRHGSVAGTRCTYTNNHDDIADVALLSRMRLVCAVMVLVLWNGYHHADDTNTSQQQHQPSKSGTPIRFVDGLPFRKIARDVRASISKGSERGWNMMESVTERVTGPETTSAFKMVKKIMTTRSVIDDHGVVDLFAKYRQRDIWMALYAYSRLQRAAHWWDHGRHHGGDSHVDSDDVQDKALVDALAYYARYATVAYGWTMNLVVEGRLHKMDDETALLHKTGIRREDVVTAQFDAKTHRPAYFIVRDHTRKTLVMCIRGTFSPHDMLTDLCCTSKELSEMDDEASFSSPTVDVLEEAEYPGGRGSCSAHHGMLESARSLQSDAETLIREELQANPEYKLVIVGHSLGGGVAALLGTLWERTFDGVTVYAYGPPCVMQVTNNSTAETTSRRPASRTRSEATIVSVVNHGDPFRCLSLGHVADVSIALSLLCEDPALRFAIMMHTDGPTVDLDDRDLRWCSETMSKLRERIAKQSTTAKLFPPGRILHMGQLGNNNNGKKRRERRRRGGQPSNSPPTACYLRHVEEDYFEDLSIHPGMFDLTRHVPSLYESRLRQLSDQHVP